MPDRLGLFLLQDPGQAGPGGLIGGFLPIILIFGIFYFLLIRPQQKERQRIESETQEMLSSLKTGDKIVTSGGIIGTIVAVRDDTINLRVADGVKFDILRSAVTRKYNDESRASDSK